MNLIDPALPPVRGLVDPAGRLVEADSRLHDLNARAGGTLGEPIAIPQLAALVRLVQKLRILVSRGIIAADGDDDVDMWVRAAPDEQDGAVRLSISGWKTRRPWTPPTGGDPQQDFVRSSANWQWETDAALCLTFISPDAGARHGFDATGLLGQPLTKLFVVAEDAGGVFPMLGALAMHQPFERQPAQIRTTGRPVLLSGTPRLDASKSFVGFVGATQMVEAAADLPPLVPQTSDRALPAAFSTRLDKALRAPLGRIIANADSIHAQSEGPLRQDYADYAADIATAGRHLLGLVDDLVDLQAIERPDFVPAAEPIDLADVARRAAGLLQVRASAANVRIDRPDARDLLPATGEFKRALQVLVNLIGNAVRYSPDDGMVWIRAERDGDHAAVVVADQGKGIAIEDQARIFEKFERVDASEPGGSGLGLYIARRLARAMGGDVTVDSAPGQGARFIFTLPYRTN